MHPFPLGLVALLGSRRLRRRRFPSLLAHASHLLEVVRHARALTSYPSSCRRGRPRTRRHLSSCRR
eukprot:3718875-Prymnesium_polylepis.1